MDETVCIASAMTAQNHPLIQLADWPDSAFAEAEGPVEGIASSIILHRDGDTITAYLNTCPHAGRRLDWSPGQFLATKEGLLVCAAHGASFDMALKGECVAGPCRGQSLLPVNVTARDGAVWLADA